MSITFEISAGPAAGQRFWLRLNQSVSVGRSREADYAIAQDHALSGIHFRVDCDSSGGWIEDLQSTNGTLLNGQSVRQRLRVVDGDEIVAGETRISVRAAGNYARNPLPVTTSQSAPVALPPAPTSLPPPAIRPVENLPASAPLSLRSTAVALSTPAHSAVAGSSQDSRSSDFGAGDESPPSPLKLVQHALGNVALLPWLNARQESRLTVIHKVSFEFDDTGRVLPATEQLPIQVEDQYESDAPDAAVSIETDMIPFKVRSDIIVVGHVYAPGGRSVTQLDAAVRVGNCSHSVRVWGDRYWSLPTMVQLVPRIVGPEPFVKLPLTYSRAFGGYDRSGGAYCDENLAGVGYINNLSAKSVHQCRLPNFEDPSQLITQYDSHPHPTGLGIWGRGWMPRLKYARTAVAPAFMPEYEFFNAAAPALQYTGYLLGHEQVLLKNLTPHGDASFRLPAFRPYVSVIRSHRGNGELARVGQHVLRSSAESQVTPRLDTLVILPDLRRFFLVYRAVFSLSSVDEPDIIEVEVGSNSG